MIGLIIALCVVCYLLVNTWCFILVLISNGGTWVSRRDLGFIVLCAFINCYVVLGFDNLCKCINEKIYRRKRNHKRK